MVQTIRWNVEYSFVTQSGYNTNFDPSVFASLIYCALFAQKQRNREVDIFF